MSVISDALRHAEPSEKPLTGDREVVPADDREVVLASDGFRRGSTLGDALAMGSRSDVSSGPGEVERSGQVRVSGAAVPLFEWLAGLAVLVALCSVAIIVKEGRGTGAVDGGIVESVAVTKAVEAAAGDGTVVLQDDATGDGVSVERDRWALMPIDNVAPYEVVEAYQLSGVVLGMGKSLALINGSMLGVGESMGGVEVVAIYPDRVRMRRDIEGEQAQEFFIRVRGKTGNGSDLEKD